MQILIYVEHVAKKKKKKKGPALRDHLDWNIAQAMG